MIISLLMIGVFLVIGELLTTSVLLIFFAAGFFSSALVLAITDNLVISIIVGIIICAFSIVLIRKPLIIKLHAKDTKSGSDSIIGKKVIVKKDIVANSAVMGEVIASGVTWNAKSEESLSKDDVAIVVELVGSHVIVKGEK